MSDKSKVLLAEDDKFISKAYGNGLEQAGFEVFVAPDGIKAEKMIKEHKPDLVLLDLVLPEKDGFDVLKKIKKDKKLKDIPVLALSNLGQDSDIEKCKELGVEDYLVKTDYTMKKVVDKVRSYLE